MLDSLWGKIKGVGTNVWNFATHPYTLFAVGAVGLWSFGYGIGIGAISTEMFWSIVSLGVTFVTPHYQRIIDSLNRVWLWFAERPPALLGAGVVVGASAVSFIMFLYNKHIGQLTPQLLQTQGEVGALASQLGLQAGNNANGARNVPVAISDNQQVFPAKVAALEVKVEAHNDRMDVLEGTQDTYKGQSEIQLASIKAENKERDEKITALNTALQGLLQHGAFAQPGQPAEEKVAANDNESSDEEYASTLFSPV